jgi:TATA-box binding protein (TBP) (component of TFIID and TFIIIB)
MANKATRNRRIRNAVFMTSTVIGVGLGCYFGSKRGFESISKPLKKMQEDLTTIAIEASNVVDILESEQRYRFNQIQNINAARELGVSFEHFPGLGIRFDSIKDLAKVEAALGLPKE